MPHSPLSALRRAVLDSTPIHGLPRSRRRILAVVILVTLAALFLQVGRGGMDRLSIGPAWLDSDLLHAAIELGAALLCLLRARWVRADRRAWLLIGVGIGLYAAGDVLWFTWLGVREWPPFPSLADAFWLSFYLLVIGALAMLARGHLRLRQRTLWLDGLIGGLAVTAVGVPPALAGGLGFAGRPIAAAM